MKRRDVLILFAAAAPACGMLHEEADARAFRLVRAPAQDLWSELAPGELLLEGFAAAHLPLSAIVSGRAGAAYGNKSAIFEIRQFEANVAEIRVFASLASRECFWRERDTDQCPRPCFIALFRAVRP